MSGELIRIGQITAPHGVHGEVRVFPLTSFPERFVHLQQVFLGPQAHPVGVHLKGSVKNLLILQIDGVQTRDEAELLRLQYLQVPKDEVYPLPEGHHYVFDLIGLTVVDPDGNYLGKLVEVDSGNAVHDLYVVETSPGKRYMVPAVREFVRAISLEEGRIVIAPVPGLLED